MSRVTFCADWSNAPRESQINNVGYESADHLLTAISAERSAIGASIFPPLQTIPGAAQPYENPESRRAQLLLKALEDLPLDKALELAVAAERFLSGDPSESTGIFSRLDTAKAGGLPATGGRSVAVSNGTGIEDHGRRSADLLNLVVLAPIDDITRYLGQHDDLITSKGSLFVVNGQSEVTRNELLEYANRLRVRQGLPTYALLPTPPVVATTNKAEPRPPKPPQPPSRKEREHWAQQVTAL
jgi:hypothetical protein